MSELRFASVVACVGLLALGAPRPGYAAGADTRVEQSELLPAVAADAAGTEGPPATIRDPWVESDGLEPPLGDPWRSPQQAQRGPRAGLGDGLVYKSRITPHWFHQNSRVWYKNDLRRGAKEFILVDAESGSRKPAFDHEKLAAALSKAAGGEVYKPDRLPFDSIEFDSDLTSIRFEAGTNSWTCRLDSYEVSKWKPDHASGKAAATDDAQPAARGRRDGEGDDLGRSGMSGVRSPNGQWEAAVKDHNVIIRRHGKSEETRLSNDGRDGLSYGRLSWAPDSNTLVAFRIEPGDEKEVYLIQSSPPGGGRARLQKRRYPLPGDKFTAYELNLFDVAKQKHKKPLLDRIDYDSPRLRWDKDGHHFTYQKVDRGHQRFRLVEVDTPTGTARNLIDEKSPTFIWTAHRENVRLSTVNWLEKAGEIIYVSERDGWRHLYLIDVAAGAVKNAITKGPYVVRGIDRIDEEARQVWFFAGGKNPDQDPYFVHYYRVNFDGSGLVALTEGDGSHQVQFSPDRRFLIDTYSRVDKPPVHELRKASDGKLVCKLEEADISGLEASGWQPPLVFVAKGRDGTTDIWGIICRPKDFDPLRKYPVIEQIYAGPQGSFVPKTFSPSRRFSSIQDAGFIVVQVDGMGTANRSKAFHDVCWRDIKDAGFADRILWHQAIAQKYPWYDLSRMGIYGTSAGGQNATAGVLFHPEFYKVAVSACGCHDNRMDKASWNEQWMGYPVGPWYSASSNIDNAQRLGGKLLLIVGEMDTNVPPESTMRLVDALIKAGKDFELLVVPNANHGMGGAYGQRRMRDFFVRHLLGAALPAENRRPLGDVAATRASTRPSGAPYGVAAPHQPPASSVGLGELSNDGSELRGVIERYAVDRVSVLSSSPPSSSPAQDQRVSDFSLQWLEKLENLEFDRLSQDGKVDYLLFKNHLSHQLRQLDIRSKERAISAALVPFAQRILDLDAARREVESMEWSKVAASLDSLSKEIIAARQTLERAAAAKDKVKPAAANRALSSVEDLRNTLRGWFSFYDGYDPLFTWWVREPYKGVDEGLQSYAAFLRQRYSAVTTGLGEGFGPGSGRRRGGGPGGGAGGGGAAGGGPGATGGSNRQQAPDPGANRERGGPIVGTPIGREALLSELQYEMISYSPEELVALAQSELKWCENEMKKAAREMGHGDDWRAALERVKTQFVEPGKQPALIRDLASEAVEYLDAHDLVTVPQLCRDSWRMAMMAPEQQLVNPFFTGGEVIRVSFPTMSMPHEAKLMSMRGNNVHFARATVFHELIPGHHLQGYMTSRYNTYRRLFSTPFWTEGWALYWELLLWDKGFARSPENRVGMLFWRMHRCARIIFSLSFHLEQMTPQKCIDFLVDEIGHERDNATAEVRRSFTTTYGPLYQAAYLLGGLQLRALHRQLVESRKMTEREFHDKILKENAIPIEMVRALLAERKLTRADTPLWKFYGSPAVKP